ncbi:adenylate/guanylate cyclase domain-containing protein [Thermoleophilia bacterium SCSIO 60948]|nr:adenylate/guanylate cyclase domain-containing protein [Thermoleophilia bacterium SCSIO 60948]
MTSTTAATFLFADLVGFTAFTERHGDEAAADLAQTFCARVCRLNTGHAAEEIKALGDACMVRVPSPVCAVELGLEIVEAVGPSQGLPRVRVGIDTGTAVRRGSDWFGSTINRAARVVAVAEEGSVLVTESVRSAAPDADGFSYTRRTARRLPGIEVPVQLYRADRGNQFGACASWHATRVVSGD